MKKETIIEKLSKLNIAFSKDSLELIKQYVLMEETPVAKVQKKTTKKTEETS